MILHYCRTSSNYIFFYFYCFDGVTPGGRKVILCVDMDKNSYLSIYRLNSDAPYICWDFLFNFWKKPRKCSSLTAMLLSYLYFMPDNCHSNLLWGGLERHMTSLLVLTVGAPECSMKSRWVKQTEYLNLKNRGTPDFSVGRERDFQRVIYLFPVSSLRFICINTNTHITYAVLC